MGYTSLLSEMYNSQIYGELKEASKSGSYLDNKKLPRVGDMVYFLRGFNKVVTKGKVTQVTDIDRRGIANTYVDIDGKYHVPLNVVFDHKPHKVKVKDIYGDTEVWR
jgi:hypothetical protein